MPSITEEVFSISTAADPGRIADTPSILGHLEADVACRVCGHNLRTRPIRRHPRTAALVCLCPQCRQFHALQAAPTGKAPGWSRFMARSLISLWVMLIGAGGMCVMITQAASTLFVLELVTTHAGQTVQVADSPRLTAAVWRYVPKKNLIEYKVLTLTTVTLTMLMVAAAAATGVVVFSHWRGWMVWLFWLLEPAWVAFLVCILWRANAPELLYWGIAVIGVMAGLQTIAAFCGVAVGRPVFRLLVRLAVPPDMRGMLTRLRQPGEKGDFPAGDLVR